MGMQSMASLWRRRAARESESLGATVQRVDARVDDGAALDRLLRPLPESAELRPRLGGAVFVRAWDAAAQRDYWVESDGLRVTCLTLSGLTLKQAAAVRVRWDALRRKPALTEDVLADLIAAETGQPVTLVS
jgi:hypothetical protein